MPFKPYPTDLKHTENDCNGDLEIKIDRKRKIVVTRCKKCKLGSEVVHGVVTKDGVPMP